MIDTAELWLTAGNGGDGAVSFRREKYVPRGGPDGGDGGRGGNIYFGGDEGLTTLLSLRYPQEVKAGSGVPGRGGMRTGKAGRDVWLPVPVGTRAIRTDGGEEAAWDLVAQGQLWCGAWGGEGGRGNAHFASSTNRVPVVAQAGGFGERVRVRLELLLLADVALVGQPNAGKSSLLAQISGARPKVASYPFTTLEPVLGVVEAHGEAFVAVEIPGLLEGAHRGVGLGDEFLRHAQRTRVAVHVVDVAEEAPLRAYEQVQQEIGAFSLEMAQRPVLVAANKVDLPGAEVAAAQLRRQLGERVAGVYPVSAVTGQGIGPLLRKVVEVLEREKREVVGEEADLLGPVVPVRPKRNWRPVEVTRASDGAFVIQWAEAERFVRGTPLREWRARVQLWDQLRRLGVGRALEKAGAGSGATIRFGEFDLEWL